MDWEILRKLQNVEFEILCVLDEYCKQYGISYSLYAGTALGAVRHGGFIPWDDDVDVAMTRIEFDKFCETWKKYPIQGYFLDSILTNDYCGTCHAKLRKDGTIFLSNGEIDDGRHHHGIWVDIFPLDKVPLKGHIKSKKIRYGKELVFLTRANVNDKNDNKKKVLNRFLLRLLPHSFRKKRILKIHKWLVKSMEAETDKGYLWKSMSTLDNIDKIEFSPKNIEGYTIIKFNKKEFPIFKNYRGLLKETFNDYMKLPPKSERVCKHTPVKLKF